MNDIQKQVQRLNRKVQRLATTEARRATSSALNKTAAKIRTQVVRDVSKEVQVQSKHVRKRVYIKRSKASTQFTRITAYRRDIPLQSLNPRKLKKGYSYRGRKYSNAFQATAKGRKQRQQIFQRRNDSRYPIDIVKIPISSHVDRVTPAIAHRIMKNEYSRILKQDLDYRIRKLSDTL